MIKDTNESLKKVIKNAKNLADEIKVNTFSDNSKL